MDAIRTADLAGCAGAATHTDTFFNNREGLTIEMLDIDVVRMMDIAQGIHVADVVRGYILDLVDATRSDPDLLLGASPRASLFLQRAARTRAAVAGRDYVLPDDVKLVLAPVLVGIGVLAVAEVVDEQAAAGRQPAGDPA